MQQQTVGAETGSEALYGFAFVSDELEDVLGRLRAEAGRRPRRKGADENEDPCRYEGLHTAIKRNREWYR